MSNVKLSDKLLEECGTGKFRDTVDAVRALEAELEAVKAERDTAVRLAELGKQVAKNKQDERDGIRLATLRECVARCARLAYGENCEAAIQALIDAEGAK